MATTPITTTNTLASLRDVFDKIKEVYLVKTGGLTPATVTTFDAELPIVGKTFNTGAPSITKMKITTGETWASISEGGDPEMSLQIATFSQSILEYFLTKVTSSASAMTKSVEGVDFTGVGYSLEPKKVVCGLFLVAENRKSAIFLPSVEVYSSLTIEDGNTAFIEAQLTPLPNAEGASFYILTPATPAS